jgi:glutathione S-transferase
MKLYYKAGACSLASHIVLKELGLPFEAVAVDLGRKTTAAGGDFNAINPKGYVPALELDDGAVLSEGTAILQYLGHLKPEAALVPAYGSMEHYRLLEWLGYINSELHKNFGPLFDPKAADVLKTRAKTLLAKRLAYTDDVLSRQPYVLGAGFCVADAYLYTVLTWAPHVGVDLSAYPHLVEFVARVASRPSVIAAEAAERG